MKKGENEALKREMVEIENKRLEEHRTITSEVSVGSKFWIKRLSLVPSRSAWSWHPS